MLIEFKIENFLSFKDLTTLSMVAAKSFKEHLDTNVIKTDGNISLLKSAVIYGNNASGKSNLLEAMGFMRQTVLNSFRDALLDNSERKFPLEKFALNTKSEKDISYFEISFFQNHTKYRYGFEIDYDKIVAEWLFHTTSKEVYLFKRRNQEIEINKSAFKEGLGKVEDVKENVLFLSLLATLGKEISSSIIDWFKNFNIVNGIHDLGHKRYTINKLKTDKEFFNWVLHFIKYLEITNLSIEEDKLSDHDLDHLITYHRKFDENNILVDSIAFNFDKEESEGTKKLLYLLGPWFDTIQKGKVLIIDELDSRLHSHLTSRLIEFFHSFNKSNAQLICAVHDVSLLTKEIFRRDQIWFVEKNQFGSSELLSLSDFKTDKVRNKSAFNKNYLEGRYGAIPYFNSDEKLNELLYGKGK
ncbi:MAG TPA: ATP-binding protein [Sediminibacterium sp.]|jgi:AAA15 family ATPase/GTPase|nr:ATP-binding protein [Sediminibacterium sp.]